jgi:hypothetical protein
MVVRRQTLACLISTILFSHCSGMQSWPTLPMLDTKLLLLLVASSMVSDYAVWELRIFTSSTPRKQIHSCHDIVRPIVDVLFPIELWAFCAHAADVVPSFP